MDGSGREIWESDALEFHRPYVVATVEKVTKILIESRCGPARRTKCACRLPGGLLAVQILRSFFPKGHAEEFAAVVQEGAAVGECRVTP